MPSANNPFRTSQYTNTFDLALVSPEQSCSFDASPPDGTLEQDAPQAPPPPTFSTNNPHYRVKPSETFRLEAIAPSQTHSLDAERQPASDTYYQRRTPEVMILRPLPANMHTPARMPEPDPSPGCGEVAAPVYVHDVGAESSQPMKMPEPGVEGEVTVNVWEEDGVLGEFVPNPHSVTPSHRYAPNGYSYS
jgi:hypothetical protein